MQKLKAYTEKFGLVVSKEIRDDDHVCEALSELCYHTKVGKVFITDGKKSKEVHFTYRPPSARPLYYTRPDGINVRTLSVNPENYPLIAHYADGHTEVIK